MTDLLDHDAWEIAGAVRAGEASAVEMAEEALRRLDDDGLGAVWLVTRERALREAHTVDAEIAAGRDPGPLAGVPVGWKDLIDTGGIRTTYGSAMFRDHVPERDADVVARHTAAGAITVAKLATHELAWGTTTQNPHFGPTQNPRDRERVPGGSSGGSAAAVAAKLVPLAPGTDTGGSIRCPASCCGVVGLKPTYGLVSRRGVFPLAFTLDHIGPMTRAVRDAALVLDALAGHDAADPGSAAVAHGNFGTDLERGVRGLRVGFVRHFHESDVPAHPEVTAALDEAAKLLKREGATVRDIRLPSLQELGGVSRIFMQAESWTVHAKWLRERPGDYAETSRRKLMCGAFLSAGDYVHAQQRRLQLTDAVNAALRDVDVLLCANSLDPACRIDDDAELARTYPRQARSPFNLTGHPALALMCGLSKSGLPISAQIVGHMHDEVTVLRAGAAYERATDWHTRRPPKL